LQQQSEWQQVEYTTADKLQVDKQTNHSRPDSAISISSSGCISTHWGDGM